MRLSTFWISAAWLAATLVGHGTAAMAAAETGRPPLGTVEVPEAADALARRVLAQGDHDGRPFAIVDKQAAMLMIYRGDGRLLGATAALLGLNPGDQAVPGVGARNQQGRLRNGDRTTTAGRFVSEPGRNRSGESVVWIDYPSALAIHRLRPGPSHERRAQRLASPNVQERRISAGCVVVPVAFFETVVEPALGHKRGVVYVMAEDGAAPEGTRLTAEHTF